MTGIYGVKQGLGSHFCVRARLSNVFLLSALLMSESATAGMGTIAGDFGLLPFDVATSQASSIFSTNSSAAYYNPAALAQTEDTQFSPGYILADPELRIKSLGGDDAPVRTGGSVAEDAKNNIIVVGLKLYLNNISPKDNNISFGLILGIEDDGKTLLTLEDNTSESGQFMRYGEKPMFAAFSTGGEVFEGVYIGGGARLNIHTSAPVLIESNLAGETSNEKVKAQGSTSFSGNYGALIDLGKILCSEKDRTKCVPGIQLAATFREESFYSLDFDANAVIPGTINPPGLDLLVYALDAYTPDITTLAIRYPFNSNWTLDFSYEMQDWSALTSQLKPSGDVNGIKAEAGAEFEDISIPRFGLIYHGLSDLLGWGGNNNLDLLAGLAFEDSPLKDGLTPDVNWIDNDRTIASFGFSYTIRDAYLFNNDLTVEGAYQYHQLDDREFTLSRTTSTPAVFETIDTDGDVSVFSMAMTVRF